MSSKQKAAVCVGAAALGVGALWYSSSQKKTDKTQSKPLWFVEEKDDPHTQSNYKDILLNHFHLCLTVDFNDKRLKGYVDVTATALSPNTTKIVLDSRNLDIKAVEQEGKEISFSLKESPVNPGSFGSALTIALSAPLQQGEKTVVRILYETTQQSEAVQWLAPEQTSGKKHPFLFTQCQAIHARSLLPCQDIPRSKVPYTAEITVEHPLSALMSAILTNKHMKTDKGEKTMVYTFAQEIPIPSYLMALCVGMLQPRIIGPRSMVWAEEEVVDIAANEFADTEKFLKTAENITGMPYQWGRYDILVLPPSFPYGGMENPCLTFATPTLLAGDRSLAGVIAHEIAHSWTGNLVTNKTWEHFWLNEGFTRFLESKIMEAIEGPKARASQTIVGFEHLKDDIEHMGAANPLTNLVPNLAGIDPDDAFSSVPYEKGCALLNYLEREMGEEKFREFFQSYLKQFQSSTITTVQFKDFLENFCASKNISLKMDWYAWTCTPGLPAVVLNYDTTYHDQSKALTDKWIKLNTTNKFDEMKGDDYLGWSAIHQQVPFMDFLLEHVKTKGLLFESTLIKMDQLYNLTSSKNSEIRFRWQRICLQCGYEPIQSQVVDFITTQGRMKFVRPLYRDLMRVNPDLAKSTFMKNRDMYHPIAAKMLGQDLNC